MLTLPRGVCRASCAPRRITLLTLSALFFVSLIAAPSLRAQAQTTGSPDIVVSQVYTRGGEPGAAFRNDFIEIFNRSNSTLNLMDYSIQFTASVPAGPGGGQVVGPGAIRFVSSTGFVPISPGQYVLYQLGSSGTDGAPIPVTPDASNSQINLVATSGRVAVVKGIAIIIQPGCPAGLDAAASDFLGYGTATCAEGTQALTAPNAGVAAVRNGNGCTDTDNNVSDFSLAVPNPRSKSSAVTTCSLPAPTNTVQFGVDRQSVGENAGSVGIFITRTGDISAPASVQIATIDKTARDRFDYTTNLGTLYFAANESTKTVPLIITDDVRPENTETLMIALGNPKGGLSLGTINTMEVEITDNDTAAPPANPIDVSAFFVRQHYADFLSRNPDAPGFAHWTNEVENCGTDAQCRQVKRINVSAAFYLSIEFQQTGYLVYRLYKATYPDNPARPRGFPTYREFWHDTQTISRDVVVGTENWPAQLEANKQRLVNEFVNRPEFLIRFPANLTATAYVDALNGNTGAFLTTAKRNELISRLENNLETRATVLRKVVENDEYVNFEFNRAFVLMQYFGYLRRNPNEGPDFSFSGYDFWLTKLNQFGGNFIEAEMVKAFISSDEYRVRFGPQ